MHAYIDNKRAQEEKLARQVSMLAKKGEPGAHPKGKARDTSSGDESDEGGGKRGRRARGLEMDSFAVCKMVTVIDDPSVDRVAKEGLFMRQFEAAMELIKYKDARGGGEFVGESVMDGVEVDSFEHEMSRFQEDAQGRIMKAALQRVDAETEIGAAVWVRDDPPLTVGEVAAIAEEGQEGEEPGSAFAKADPGDVYKPSFNTYENGEGVQSHFSTRMITTTASFRDNESAQERILLRVFRLKQPFLHSCFLP